MIEIRTTGDDGETTAAVAVVAGVDGAAHPTGHDGKVNRMQRCSRNCEKGTRTRLFALSEGAMPRGLSPSMRAWHPLPLLILQVKWSSLGRPGPAGVEERMMR